MREFIAAVERAIETKNWHAALSIALMMPDICGSIVDGAAGSTKKRASKDRYQEFFKDYLQQHYHVSSNREDSNSAKVLFLGGDDFYALRCAFLHEGTADILGQTAREKLEGFAIVAPDGRNYIHCNQVDGNLQLQVDVFCRQIIEGVKQWLSDNEANNELQAAIRDLLVIGQLDRGI
jgi:hypothetical protein